MNFIIKPFPKRYKIYFWTVTIICSSIALPLLFLYGFDPVTLVISLENFVLAYATIGSLYIYDIITDKFNRVYKNRIWIKLFLSVGIVFLTTVFLNEIEQAVGFEDDDQINLGSIHINPYWTNVVVNCSIWLLASTVILISENVIDKQRINLKEAKEELSVLKTELYSANVKPHFIFNTLNGLITLIHEDPDKAENLVIQLSDFLRNSLYQANGSNHSLAQEAKLIIEYLDIEKIRFGDRFDFEFKLTPQAESVIVPKFFSLSLVENCIKHNSSLAHLFIRYNAFIKNEHLILEIEDNGEPFPSFIDENEGLKSTRSILSSKYQDAFDLSFVNEKERKYVLLKIKL